MKTTLWTVWCEYFATGEGVSYSAIITYAKSAKEAKKLYIEKFGDYLAIGCEVKKGVVCNKVTSLLFSETLLDNLEKHNEHSGSLFAYGEFHLNKS